MISEERKAEIRSQMEGRSDRTLSDDEFERIYKQEVQSMLVPTPPRYRGVSSDDIPKEVLERWPFNKNNEKHGLYLWGGVGTGKTHVLYAIRVKMAESLFRFRVVNMSELFAEIKHSFNTDNVLDIVEEGSYYHGFDDIGTEKDTEWAGEQMYRLVNQFYENRKNFVFTSNLSLKELAGRFGEQGDRIASRIAEMCEVIEIKGKDRRV